MENKETQRCKKCGSTQIYLRLKTHEKYCRTCGYVHSAKDENGIEFSKGGVSYQGWLNGEEPKPLKELYCPLQWTGQTWKSPLFCKDTFFGGLISECPYRNEHGTSNCWAAYELSQ